jgi:hypothetical protein
VERQQFGEFGCGEDERFCPKESCNDVRPVGKIKNEVFKKKEKNRSQICAGKKKVMTLSKGSIGVFP